MKIEITNNESCLITNLTNHNLYMSNPPGESGNAVSRRAGVESGKNRLADFLFHLLAFALQRGGMIVSLRARVEKTRVLFSLDIRDPMRFLFGA